MHIVYSRLKGFLTHSTGFVGCGDGYDDGDYILPCKEGNGDHYGTWDGDGTIKIHAENPDGNGHGDGGDDYVVEYGSGGDGVFFEWELIFEKDD